MVATCPSVQTPTCPAHSAHPWHRAATAFAQVGPYQSINHLFSFHYTYTLYSFLVSVSRFSSRLVFALLLYCCFCPLPDTAAANLRSILFIARQSFSFVTGSQRHPLAPRYTTLSPPPPNFFFLLFSITRVWYSTLTPTHPTCLLTSSPCSRSPRLWSPPRLPCP